VGEVEGQGQVEWEQHDVPLRVGALVWLALRKVSVVGGMGVAGVQNAHREDTCAGPCHMVEHRRADSSPLVSKALLLQELAPASSYGGLCVPGGDLGGEGPDIQKSSHRVDLPQEGVPV
jgi:hypothetical protein